MRSERHLFVLLLFSLAVLYGNTAIAAEPTTQPAGAVSGKVTSPGAMHR